MGDFTAVLARIHDGDATPEAVNELFDAAYGDLKELARNRLRLSGPMTLLDTTELVHESYMRFLKVGHIELADRARFLGYASRVMRSVIVDFVRRRSAERRGGDEVHVTLNTGHENIAAREEDFLRLDDALNALAGVDAQLVRIVEMRFFAGLSVDEVAAALDVSPRTVFREWDKARMILRDAIAGD
jgi:RNA polymerase sigma factor (TIGR02999 family)